MAKAEGFVYDKNGNRRFDRGAKDYKYDAANRVLSNSVYTYTHDVNGNLTSRTEIASSSTITCVYNPEQQLSQVITPKDNVEYKYDPLGRRTEKTVNANATRYLYDGQNIIADLDMAGNPINTYTNGPGVDEPLIMAKSSSGNYYYHAVALGSIIAITDDKNAIVEAYQYKAYGLPILKNAARAIIQTSQICNTRMFAGREYEPETGFYFNRARYWDPARGTFTQEDPIAIFRYDANFYVYTNNNPVKWIDPSGLIITDEQLGNKTNLFSQQLMINSFKKSSFPDACGPGGNGPEFLQEWGGVDFRSACFNHDSCYESGYRFGKTRSECDWEFVVNLGDTSGSRIGALEASGMYYYFVRTFGFLFYNSGPITKPQFANPPDVMQIRNLSEQK